MYDTTISKLFTIGIKFVKDVVQRGVRKIHYKYITKFPEVKVELTNCQI